MTEKDQDEVDVLHMSLCKGQLVYVKISFEKQLACHALAYRHTRTAPHVKWPRSAAAVQDIIYTSGPNEQGTASMTPL